MRKSGGDVNGSSMPNSGCEVRKEARLAILAAGDLGVCLRETVALGYQRLCEAGATRTLGKEVLTCYYKDYSVAAGATVQVVKCRKGWRTRGE